MISRDQIHKLERTISDFDPSGANRYVLYGSSVREPRFRDIDLGVLGNKVSRKHLSVLREHFYDSTIPYAVDVVDFDEAEGAFRDYVLQNEPILWIR